MVQHQAKAIMQGWSETFVHDDQELVVPDRRTEGHRGPCHPAQQLLHSPRKHAAVHDDRRSTTHL